MNKKDRLYHLIDFGEIITSVIFKMLEYYKLYKETGKDYHFDTFLEGFNLIVENVQKYRQMFEKERNE